MQTGTSANTLRRSSSWQKPLLVTARCNPVAELKANGDQLFGRGETKEALKVYKRVLAVLKNDQSMKGGKQGSQSVLLLLDVYCEMAMCYTKQGQSKRTLDAYKKALELSSNSFGSGSLGVAEINDLMGGVLSDMGKYKEAIDHFVVALDIYRGHQENCDDEIDEENDWRCPSSPLIPKIYCSIGNCYHSLKDGDQAIFHLERAMEGFQWLAAVSKQKGVPCDIDLDMVACANTLALVYQGEKRYMKAIRYHKEALRFSKVHGIEASVSYMNLGLCYQAQGRSDKALTFLRESLIIRMDLHGVNHPETAVCLTSIAVCLQNEDRMEKAIEYFERAQQSLELSMIQDKESDLASQVYAKLWQCYKTIEEDHSQALEYYEKAQRTTTTMGNESSTPERQSLSNSSSTLISTSKRQSLSNSSSTLMSRSSSRRRRASRLSSSRADSLRTRVAIGQDGSMTAHKVASSPLSSSSHHSRGSTRPARSSSTPSSRRRKKITEGVKKESAGAGSTRRGLGRIASQRNLHSASRAA